MSDDDESFWTTYIASTPEQDKDFKPRNGRTGWLVATLIVLGMIIFLILI